MATQMGVTRSLQDSRRVCTQLGGANVGSGVTPASTEDYNARYLHAIAATPVRFRLRIRNKNVLLATSADGVGRATITAYVGVPAAPPTGTNRHYRWTGTLNAAATSIPFTTNGTTLNAATELVSDWVTNAGYITAFRPFVISVGYAGFGGTGLATDSFVFAGGDSCGGLGRLAASAASAANSTSSFTATTSVVYGDVRLEYEYLTDLRPDGFPVVPHVLCIGDSITMGTVQSAFASAGPYNFGPDIWPNAAGLRGRFCVQNLGVGQSRALDAGASGGGWDVATSTAHRYFARGDISTSVPDAAIVALGMNDINAGTSFTNFQTALDAVCDNLRTLGIPRIYVCTVIPGGAPLARLRCAIATNSSGRLTNPGVLEYDYTGSGGWATTNLPGAAILRQGMPIAGTNIPSNSIIGAETSPGTFEIVHQATHDTQSATATNASDTITFRGEQHYTTEAKEMVRQQINNWLLQVPAGAVGVFDHAKAVELDGFPAIGDPRYLPHHPHPVVRGHQRMASVVQI